MHEENISQFEVPLPEVLRLNEGAVEQVDDGLLFNLTAKRVFKNKEIRHEKFHYLFVHPSITHYFILSFISMQLMKSMLKQTHLTENVTQHKDAKIEQTKIIKITLH